MEFSATTNFNFNVTPMGPVNKKPLKFESSNVNINYTYTEPDYTDVDAKETEPITDLTNNFYNIITYEMFNNVGESAFSNLSDGTGFIVTLVFQDLLKVGLMYGSHVSEDAYITPEDAWDPSLQNTIKSVTKNVLKSKEFKMFLSDNFKNLIFGMKYEGSKILNMITPIIRGLNDARVDASGINFNQTNIIKMAKNVVKSISNPASNILNKASNTTSDLMKKKVNVLNEYVRLDGVNHGKLTTIYEYKVVSFGSILSKFGIDLGIDYLATIFTNIIIATHESGKLDLSLSAAKYGSTFLKSTTKLICSTAGELIGGKSGKLVGTMVGSMISEAQVKSFDKNEGWCAIAGAAEIIGGIACVVAYVAIASNPVGWAIGLALICGATIGYVTTKIVYEWDNIERAIGEAVTIATNFVCDTIEFVSEYVGDILEVAIEFGTDVLDTAAEIATSTIEYASHIIDTSIVMMQDHIEFLENAIGDLADCAAELTNDTIGFLGTALDNVVVMGKDTVDYIGNYYGDIADCAVDLKTDVVEFISAIKDDSTDVKTDTIKFFGNIFGDILDTAVELKSDKIEFMNAIIDTTSVIKNDAIGYINNLFDDIVDCAADLKTTNVEFFGDVLKNASAWATNSLDFLNNLKASGAKIINAGMEFYFDALNITGEYIIDAVNKIGGKNEVRNSTKINSQVVNL